MKDSSDSVPLRGAGEAEGDGGGWGASQCAQECSEVNIQYCFLFALSKDACLSEL